MELWTVFMSNIQPASCLLCRIAKCQIDAAQFFWRQKCKCTTMPMTLDYPLWLRAAHFFNFLFLSLLVRSGLEILSAHPRLYWNDDCTPGTEWLRFTRKRLPVSGLWTSRDEEESFSSWIALPGR